MSVNKTELLMIDQVIDYYILQPGISANNKLFSEQKWTLWQPQQL